MSVRNNYLIINNIIFIIYCADQYKRYANILNKNKLFPEKQVTDSFPKRHVKRNINDQKISIKNQLDLVDCKVRSSKSLEVPHKVKKGYAG